VERAIPAEELLDQTPGTMLRGARYREDMTQVQLAEVSGIPRRHISDMENNRRPIGKQAARKLAEVLKVDYRVFL
jgi:transcriptional regulator with XRE-family HTH domain